MKTGTVSAVMTTVVAVMCASVAAQWHEYPTVGVPRLPNGKPDLSAPTPRRANGQPDLSGIWQVPGLKYLINIAADLKEVPFQPWAEAVYKERLANLGKDDPNNRCLPSIIPEKIAVTSPWKIVDTPGVTIVLYESRTIFRQIFTDGRPFPKDMNPAWQGYSVGQWEGDTFVVETKASTTRAGWIRTAIPSPTRCMSSSATGARTSATWMSRSRSTTRRRTRGRGPSRSLPCCSQTPS
jgi:hypothetical protein